MANYKCLRCGTWRTGPLLDGYLCRACKASGEIVDRERLDCLAANLRVAAGLEMAYLRGHSRGIFRPLVTDSAETKEAYQSIWAPGRGRVAPGWEQP